MKNLKNYESYPLSPLQEGILFHMITEPNSGVYVIQWLCTIREPLDRGAFERAWEQVIERHDILRTRFEWEGIAEPVQIVEPDAKVTVRFNDWRSVSSEDIQKRFDELLTSERFQGIKLNELPLIGISVFETGESEFKFLFTYPHTIIDGGSARLIFEELFTFYYGITENREVELPKPRPYGDYIKWLKRQDFSQNKEYWQNALKGFESPNQLPNPIKTVKKIERKGLGYESLIIDNALTSQLEDLARQNDLRLNILIQAAWALLLYHYSGKTDVVFGTIRSGRYSPIEGIKSMVGLFINNLPVRVHIEKKLSLLELLKDLQRQNLELRRQENTPLTLIHDWSEVSNGVPLFETLYVFDRGTYNSPFHEKGGRWLNLDLFERSQTNYPMTLLAFANSEIVLHLEYDRNRFEQCMIKPMLGEMRLLLEEMTNNLHSCAVNVPYMGLEENCELAANETERAYDLNRTLMDLFERQVERTPEATAVVYENNRLTYLDLDSRANQVGRFLQRFEVGPDVMVGLFVDRSVEMVVGIYGILKAGGAYVPLDPEYPAERLGFMVDDTRVPIILTQQHLAGCLPRTEANVVCLDSDWENISAESSEPLKNEVGPSNLAYVIYTSGSTGRPKGVMNEHRGIVNRLLWMQDEYRLNETDRVLQKTPFSFDVSVWEFFWPLLFGARLVIAQPGGHRDSAYLVDIITKEEITTLHFVPSMLQIFLEEEGVGQCKSIRRVICSGEALPYELQEKFFEKLDTELHNLYGPTEAAVDVTYWPCERDSSLQIVPIGRPVANTKMYILNEYMQPLPIGACGELHIGGVQVARGYLNRPELTAEKFIPDPFTREPGARLYRTGDLCRYLPDGNIEYLGRNDFQVKIRGLRIEIGEIEGILTKHPAVREAVVVAREDVPGDKRLVAYLIGKQKTEINLDDLREFLKAELPGYMVPSVFVELEAFPLTGSGKVDRKALPEPKGARQTEKAYEAPKGRVEQMIGKIWQEVLEVEKVGVHDNFFDLGGHSLLLVRVRNKLQGYFQKEIPIVDMFERPTIKALAEFLSDEKKGGPLFDRIQERAMKQKEILKRRRQTFGGRGEF